MKTIDEYMKLPWKTDIRREVAGDKVYYVASNPELESCLGQGETAALALRDLEMARRDLLSVLMEIGVPIPVPDWSSKEPAKEPAPNTWQPVNVFYKITQLGLAEDTALVMGAQPEMVCA